MKENCMYCMNETVQKIFVEKYVNRSSIKMLTRFFLDSEIRTFSPPYSYNYTFYILKIRGENSIASFFEFVLL